MPRTPQEITEAELAVLQCLWDHHHPQTIRQITDRLYPRGAASAYATVQKLLERLESKSFVRRDRAQAVHTFEAIVLREELIARKLRTVAQQLCGGSMAPLLTHLVKSHRLSAAQRDELRELIDQLDEESKKKK